MKTAQKFFASVLMLSFLVLTSCSKEESDSTVDSPKMKFLTKNYETLEELGKTFPKEDLQVVFSETENGMEALYSLKGKSADDVKLGMFAAKSDLSDKGGTDCNGPYSCGRALNKCLENGKDGLISNGKCPTTSFADSYCVTCQDPK